MKTSKELFFIPIAALPWLTYAWLRNRLPAYVPSHYSVTENGWKADGAMHPVNFLLAMTFVIALVYALMSLPALIRRNRPVAMINLFYYFKLALAGFFAIIQLYTLITAAHLLPNPGGAVFSNISMLLIVLITNIFTYAMFRLLKKSGKLPASATNFNIIRICTHVVISIAPLITIMTSQGIVSGRLLPEALLLFFAILGNLTYNIKPNYFIGIRTPWTLKSEEVWRRTHHFGGIWTFITGLTGFVICIFAPVETLHTVVQVVIFAMAGICILYSYIIYKKVGA